MANTFELIASNTLGASAASVSFSSIPTTYTDLILKYSVRTDGAARNGQFLTITAGATVLNSIILRGDGAAVTSQAPGAWQEIVNGSTSTANTFTVGECYFANYTQTTTRQFSSYTAQEDNQATAWLVAQAFYYTRAGAVATITLTGSSANLLAGSSFFLYGIKNT